MALRTLYQALLDSDPARLRIIASLWNIQLTTTRKADMAAELVAAMASAESVAAVLADLPAEQQAALDDVLRHESALPWAVFVRRNGEVRTLGAGRVEREALWREPASAAEALWFMGLVQRAFADQDGQAVEMAFVPEDLRLYMPAPPPLEIPPPPTTTAPEAVTLGTDSLADDLVTVWAALQREETAPDPPLSALNPPAEARLRLLKGLCEETGWIRTDDSGRPRPGANEILSWLKADLWTQWSALAHAWIASETWNDVAHIPALKPDPVNPWPNAPRSTRQAFLRALSRCEPGAWYTIEAFKSYVKTYATDFLRQDGIYDTWAPRDAQTEIPLRGFEAWDAVEGELIAFLIAGPLSWLGLVDTGHAAGTAREDVFRLSEAGAAVLDLAAPPALPEPSPLRLLANADVIAPRRRRYERFQLSRIAERIQEGDATPAEGYRYRLTPASLDRAKRQRIPLGRITTFLKEATASQALPSTLETAIQRAYRGEGQTKLAHPWILRVSDPKQLQIPELMPLIVARLTPELAVVREKDRERIRQLLAEHGFLVDVDDA
ncbi:MAG: hypothetical protein JXC32_16285 [Anaerolineae bacterium]|nr:hypothetical protein [Anaerolineae bacterium]